MAIAIKSVTVGTNDGSSTTVSVTTSESPSATSSGDLVVVFHSNDYFTLGAMPTPTATGSPTLTAVTSGSADGGTNEPHIKAYTYVANTGGAQTISVTETGLADEEKVLVAYVLSGADTATPVDIAGGTTLDSAGLSHVLSSISPTQTNSYLIAHVQGSADFNGGTWTSPGTMTERYDAVLGSCAYTGATEQLAASGATGTRTFSSSASHQMVGVMVAVKTSAAAAAAASLLPPRSLPPFLAPGILPRPRSYQLLGDASGEQFPQLADTAAGDDGTLTVAVAVPLADTATAADSLSVAVAAPLTETATATDSATVTAAFTLADTASGTDDLVSTTLDPNQAMPVQGWMFRHPRFRSLQYLGGAQAPPFSRTNLLGESNSTLTTSAVTSTAFTPPDSSLLVVSLEVVQEGGDGTAPTNDLTISDSVGLIWTRQAAVDTGATTYATAVVIWTASVSSGASMTVTFDCGARNIDNYTYTVVAYTGYSTAQPIGATGTNSASPSSSANPRAVSLTLNGTSLTSSEIVASVGFDSDNGGSRAVTPGTGWTELYDLDSTAAGYAGMETEIRTSYAGTSVDWTNINVNSGHIFNWAAAAVEIRSASTLSDQSITLADTAGGADDLTIAVSAPLTDTATGDDALTVAAAASLTDTATGTDTATVAVTLSVSDTADATDALSVSTATGADSYQNPVWIPIQFATPRSASLQTSGDTSTGIITLTDSGTGSESLTAAVAVPLSDTATASDSLSVAVTVTMSDTATGSDDVAAMAAVTLSETAAAADSVSVSIAGGSDPNQFLVPNKWGITRPGVAIDPPTLQLLGDASGSNQVGLTDNGTADDSLTISVTVTMSDTAAGADALANAVAVPLAELVSAADALALVVITALSETASVTEDLHIGGQGIQGQGHGHGSHSVSGNVYPKSSGAVIIGSAG